MAIETWDWVNTTSNEIEGTCEVFPAESTEDFMDSAGQTGVYYYDEPNETFYTWDGFSYSIYNSFVGHRPRRPIP